ncbi:MAG: hypothetical protein E7434_03820 [Ruminococcaceae bacterium]|nr:hypothetical protein [Oscillospiraceae bacterium]
MKRLIIMLGVVLSLLLNVAATEKYTFPNDWSKDALKFAVENEILAGDENYDLKPKENITRAEMAAVLVRLLAARKQADLSGYDDISANAWYYEELSAAVACGIFGGVSATKMQPNQPITREQAVVVICRAFGIVSTERDTYKEFSDKNKISAYARDSVSAMKHLGLVDGYHDGTFGPKRSITRAEVAQLLYNIFDCIADVPGEIPEQGTVIYRGAEPLPEELSIDGALIIGQACDQVTASNWTVTDSLVLRGGEDFSAELVGLNTQMLFCAPLSGTIHAAQMPAVYLWGNETNYSGDAESLTVMGGKHTYNGTTSAAELRAGSLIYNGNANEIVLQASTKLELNGEAATLTVRGENAKVEGEGKAALIMTYPEKVKIDLAYDEWQDVWQETYLAEHDTALEVVQTQRVPCSVWKRATLYEDKAMTKILRILEVGTTVYFEYHPDDRIYVSLEDGTKGWMMRHACGWTEGVVSTDSSVDYSEPIKEGFVNLNGYESKTDYLIWISKYTQKVMVYEGEKGNWNLIRTFHCATGANETPTPAGVFEIFKHTDQWDFPDHCVRQVSVFNGGHAFHTVLLNFDGTFYNRRVGEPISHGCVRLMPDDANYIFNLPMNTCVVVY